MNAPEPTPAKRLTLSQIVERLIDRPSRSHSSVSLSRSTTGAIGIDVSVAVGDEGDAATVEEAAQKASALFSELRADFPEPEPHDQAEVSLTRNAKGETQMSVSAKTHGAGIAKLSDLEAEVRKVYDGTRMKYPMADGHSAKPGSVRA